MQDNENNTADQSQFMQLAIELAAKCVSESGKVSSKVGAVVVKDGVILAVAVGTAVTCRPPAQIRTCGTTAYGSCLGYVTRSDLQGKDVHSWV